MEQPLVSVIIPVFKVENYLDRCIESLVNQTYENIEIILVDDGSPDNCATMCDEWATKDDRIIIIKKSNGGQAEARNYGMQLVCGEFISFIDSDDFISADFFENMISSALEHGSDIIVCDFAKCYESGECEKYHDDLAVCEFSAFEGMAALIDGSPFYLHVWDKIYKRKVVEGIDFEVGKIHEDVFWLYQAFGSANCITKINCTMYFYLQRESSTTGRGYSSLRSLDFLDQKWKCKLYIEKNYPKIALQAKIDFFCSCMYLMQCVIKNMSGSEKRLAIAKIRNYKKICRLSFRDIKTVQGSARKYYYLAKINIYLCCKMRADLNIGF